MTLFYALHPDFGQHAWHEENGFFHGSIHGVYYRMVCSRKELEEARERESRNAKRLITSDVAWSILNSDGYANPWNARFGEFESASPFEEDQGFEARRQIIALNMYLDPDTTTWYGLEKEYASLMRLRPKDREKALEQRMHALRLDPEMERYPSTRKRRTLAFEFGLNPYKATSEEIYATGLKLHKIVLPRALSWRAENYLEGKAMTFGALVQTALASYLDAQKWDKYGITSI
jgi:hypothetical protein